MSSFEMPDSEVAGEVSVPEAMVISSSPWPRRILEGAILVLALAVGLTIRFCVLEPAVVISSSMKPTFGLDSRVLLDIRSSLHGNYQRGDAILFNAADKWKSDEVDEDTLMKRIIGLPGETVRVDAQGTFIDGQRIDEPYIAQEETEHDPVIVTLGDDEYFVMGDNRNNSEDSRDHGAIKDSDIRGRVILQLAPFDKFGRVSRPAYNLPQQ